MYCFVNNPGLVFVICLCKLLIYFGPQLYDVTAVLHRALYEPIKCQLNIICQTYNTKI